MIRRLIVACVVLAASTASADKVDTTGWTLLGTQSVKGKSDRDSITVGKHEGKFDQLQVVVTDADVKINDLVVVFTNGQKWSPQLKYHFREGQRSHAIDLPGNDRAIARIDLVYGAARPGDMADVSVYARDRKGGGGGSSPGQAVFDPKGWKMLGSGVVNGKKDRDVVFVGKNRGGFDQLTMRVVDSDLELDDFKIVFASGQKWSPQLKHTFKEGARTRAIDLPGKDRAISRIELAYKNLPGGGKAKVEIYGRDVGRPAPPAATPVVWEKKGWTFLGKSTVDGWKDRDRLAVRKPKAVSELMFVVAGSDVKLDKVTVTLGNGEKFETQTGHTFKEGARTRPIDIPGALRKIKAVDFAYTNLPGGGKATVEVWGRAKK